MYAFHSSLQYISGHLIAALIRRLRLSWDRYIEDTNDFFGRFLLTLLLPLSVKRNIASEFGIRSSEVGKTQSFIEYNLGY